MKKITGGIHKEEIVFGIHIQDYELDFDHLMQKHMLIIKIFADGTWLRSIIVPPQLFKNLWNCC